MYEDCMHDIEKNYEDLETLFSCEKYDKYNTIFIIFLVVTVLGMYIVANMPNN